MATISHTFAARLPAEWRRSVSTVTLQAFSLMPSGEERGGVDYEGTIDNATGALSVTVPAGVYLVTSRLQSFLPPAGFEGPVYVHVTADADLTDLTAYVSVDDLRLSLSGGAPAAVDITDATPTGVALLTAASGAAAREAIGAEGTGWVLAGRRYAHGERPRLDQHGHILFGAHVSLAAHPDDTTAILAREAQLGRTLDIAHDFYTWTDATLPALAAPTAHVAAGRIPLIAWEGTSLAGIIAGTHDAWITQVATAMRDAGYPILLRWAWEMNGDWYPWSGPQNGADPSLYVSAWQRIWRIFQTVGATNVAFVWSPNSSSTPGGVDPAHANSWRAYYPGDAYVDVLGTSIYNAVRADGLEWNGVRTYGDPIAQDWITGMGGLTDGTKPMMACEWGCYIGASTYAGNKPQWVTNAAGFFADRGFSAVVYFDTDTSSSLIPWAMDSTPAALAAFVEMAQDPRYGGPGIGGTGHRAKVLALAPYAYWRCSDAPGGAITNLGSGGHSGTTVGNIMRRSSSKVPGLGGGVSTAGGAHIDVTTMGILGSSLSAGFTVEMLVQIGAVGTATPQGALLATLNAGTTTALGIYTHTSRSLANAANFTTFHYRNEAGVTRALDLIDATLYDGRWHHVVWVCDPAAATDTVYIDGAAASVNSSTNAANIGPSANFGYPLTLLARDNRGTIDYKPVASLDEVAIYTSKLTAPQVAALWASVTA